MNKITIKTLSIKKDNRNNNVYITTVKLQY